MKSQRLIVQTSMMLAFTLITIMTVEAYVTDGLVSYYRLDEDDIAGDTVKDVAGGKDGTILGQPKSIEGHLGEALEFGGQPECVELPSIFNIAESPASYEAWFLKQPNSRIGWQYLLTNKTDFNDHFFRLGFNQNTGQLRYYTEQANNVRKAWVTDDDYADGEWHHVDSDPRSRCGEVVRRWCSRQRGRGDGWRYRRRWNELVHRPKRQYR